MPNIDLTHNTGLGEQERAERERQRRRTEQRQQYSRPAGVPKPLPPPVQKPGLFARLRSFVRSRAPRPRPRNLTPRILRAQRVPEPSRPAPLRPVQPPVKAASPAPRPSPPKTRPVKQSPPPPSNGAFDVNLVPADMMARLGTHDRFVALGFVALTSVLIVALLFVALSLVRTAVQRRAEANRASITAIDRQLADFETEKRNALAFHSAALQGLTLLDQHVYWTKFFSGLEKYTVDSVYFRSINADHTGRLALTATGLDFRSVSRQLLAFAQAKDFVKSVSITAASLQGAESSSPLVDFTVTVTLADGVFLRTAEGPATFTTAPAAP